MLTSRLIFRHALVGLALTSALLAPSLVNAREAAGAASASGRVQTSVIAPLRIDALNDLNFGCFAVSGDGKASVSAQSSAASYDGGVTPVSMGSRCAPEPARFRIVGEERREYRFAIASASIAHNVSGGTGSIPVSGLHGRSSGLNADDAGLLDSAGEDRLLVGGTLAIPAGTSPGRYVAKVTVTVSYN